MAEIDLLQVHNGWTQDKFSEYIYSYITIISNADIKPTQIY